MEIAENLPKEVEEYPAQAMALTVTDQVTLGTAGEAVKALKGYKKTIVDFFAPMKRKAHDAHKEITTKEKEALAPLDEAEKALRGRMNSFLLEQQRIQLENERKERLRAEEAARKEREKLEKRAEKALESGKDEKADDLLEQVEDVYVAPISTPQNVVPIRTGDTLTTTVDKLVVEVLDIKAFVKALCEKDSALTMLKVGQRELTAWAKANGIERFPGLRIEKTKVASVR